MTFQSLELDHLYFQPVLAGQVTATIRIGHRNIEPGGLTFKSPDARYLPLDVIVDHVIKTTFLGISDHDAKLAGYNDGEHARDEMRFIYPETELDTPFTVIRFYRAA